MSIEKRPREVLKGASDLLHYEIWMFERLVAGMGADIVGKGSVFNNALLEAFAIHVRVLYHFFYSEPRKNDIVAGDFFDDPQVWKEKCPEITDSLKNAKKRADKEVAHLTYDRLKVTPEKKPWNFVEIFADLEKVISTFISSVPHEYLGERWQPTLKENRTKSNS